MSTTEVGDQPNQKFGPPPQVLSSIYEVTPEALEQIAQWLEVRGIRGMLTGSTAGTVSGGGGITGGGGAPGPPGSTGPAGPTGPTGSAGPGVPTGGTAGQELVKNSSTNYDTSWVTPTGGGAWTLLSNTTLGSAGTFDVSSISGAYNDLIVVLIARSTLSGTTDNPIVRFNNDSGTNYALTRVRGDGSTVGANNSSTATSLAAQLTIPGSTATANAFGVIELTIPGYASTTWTKMCHWTLLTPWIPTSGTGMYITVGGGAWNSTAAINRIQAQNGSGGNLATGSQLRIYGVT